MQYKSSKTSQRPQKPRHGDQLIHLRYTKSSPQEPNVSFRCQATIREGQVELCYNSCTAFGNFWNEVG